MEEAGGVSRRSTEGGKEVVDEKGSSFNQPMDKWER